MNPIKHEANSILTRDLFKNYSQAQSNIKNSSSIRDGKWMVIDGFGLDKKWMGHC